MNNRTNIGKRSKFYKINDKYKYQITLFINYIFKQGSLDVNDKVSERY
ncbi:hypothetical protein N9Y89_00695 [bacterium]|nr:hypothetical protein [bacterium]